VPHARDPARDRLRGPGTSAAPPKTAGSDAGPTKQIRAALRASPWLGEGFRTAWAWLRRDGIRTSQARVLQLMRAAELLAPTRDGRAHGPRAHHGTLTPDRPDEIGGTDPACTLTGEGPATIGITVDHCSQEGVGIPAPGRGGRLEAVEPIHPGVSEHIGGCTAEIATGLTLPHDTRGASQKWRA